MTEYAFPKGPIYDIDGEEVQGFSHGMTLRDWFAGLALQQVMAQAFVAPSGSSLEEIAWESYKQADAMLAMRSARESQTP